ncbi:MAG: cysteine--tRNA ligase, partial [Syntrophales bacterium]|nr:cysteine--tRNA ligase [Syntrophales bacterium]
MSLRIYNTRTKKKETFKPLREGKVGIYVCGITAYDVCHAGHARSAVVFDVIKKYLQCRGYDVIYVKNFTDLDDKIIKKAISEGVDISEIADRYIRTYNEDMDNLGVDRPTISPRATEHIDGMISLINTLLQKGLAYRADGDVYYAVEKWKNYGKLSGRDLKELMAGARVEVNEKKRNPLDFALWKASKEGEPWWDSPWGQGRPGWHIECSVMSQRFLGDTFDIHGGGEDLIFPHHENEIAQSEGASGKPLANFWIHNGFIRIKGEKMSKSIGNTFTIKDMLKNYHPEVLRLFMLTSHYRSPLDFSDDSLDEARLGMDRFYAALKNIKDILLRKMDYSQISLEKLQGRHRDVCDRLAALSEKFLEAMDDDFNMVRAIGYIFDAVRLINGYMADEQFVICSETLFVLHTAKRYFEEVGRILGLFLDEPDYYFCRARDRKVGKLGLDIKEIEHLIEERRVAREAKDWGKADEIRRLLAEKRVSLKDTPSGATWEI